MVKDRARFRTFEADSVLAGLGLAGLPGAVASSGVWDRVEFVSACQEAGAVYGVTGVLDEEGLKTVEPLGNTWGISNNAIPWAKTGEADSLNGPARVSKGSAVWRAAEYVAPRTLTFAEAKEAARERMIHARAEKKAREAATDFIAELVEGTADLGSMKETPYSMVGGGSVKPFVLQGAGEVPTLPAAFKENGMQVVTEESRRQDEELAVMRTAHYRVAIVEGRRSPPREEFENNKGWRQDRTGGQLPLVRWRFMVDHWRDEVREGTDPRNFIEDRK